jgi:hypothetical protein
MAVIMIIAGGTVSLIADQTTGQVNQPTSAQTLDSYMPSPVTFYANLTGILSGQSFTFSGSQSWQVGSVTFLMNQSMAWQGSIFAALYLNTGTPGAGATPTGNAIATSTTVITTANLQTGPAVQTTFAFANSPKLKPGTYWAVLDSSTVIPNVPSGPKAWYSNAGLANHNRAFYNPPPPVWTAINNQNLWFIVTGQFVTSLNLNSSPGVPFLSPLLTLFVPAMAIGIGLRAMRHGKGDSL